VDLPINPFRLAAVFVGRDEMRVGQKGRVAHCWWERGHRPPGQRDTRTEYAYVFGAVRPTATTTPLVMPEANAIQLNRFLALVFSELAEDEHALMTMDGAGYHRSGRLEIPGNITIKLQPRYYPEVNPVERVWQYLGERYLSHRVFKDYHAILDACCDAWKAVAELPVMMKSLTDFPYIQKVRT
jgi:hypothetical protein